VGSIDEEKNTMSDTSNDSEQLLLERVWEFQNVLQMASGGDYTVRCKTNFMATVEDDPLAMLAPAINTLVAEVENGNMAVAEREQLIDQKERTLEVQEIELAAKLETISLQAEAIRELSTPIIPLFDGILVLPLVGTIDTKRASDILRALLRGIREHSAEVVLIDVTGVAIVDTGVANHLYKAMQAARLKGANPIVTGLSDSVAETIVDMGIDWRDVATFSDLQSGLRAALKMLGIRLRRRSERL
jgi:anti-anti-sigma regulatory factor